MVRGALLVSVMVRGCTGVGLVVLLFWVCERDLVVLLYFW